MNFVLVISPILFTICHSFSQLYFLLYLKVNIRLLFITNFLIALSWYFCFHYYLALLDLNSDLQKCGVETLTLNDPWILATLISNSLATESIFRSLFVETCVLLYLLGENLNLTIVISNIF